MELLTHLYAFLLAPFFFLYCGLIGFSFLCWLRPKAIAQQNLLLSPVAGVSLLLLAIFSLSFQGLAVSSFALALTLASPFLSLAYLLTQKPKLPWRSCLVFALILVPAYGLIAEPLLRFGFNWLSFSNDDMANYVLAAQRLLQHGYLEVPSATNLMQGREYSLYLWFLDAMVMERTGTQLLLAWLSSVSTLHPLQAFMSLTLGLHLMILSTTAAMVYTQENRRSLALATLVLVAASGLGTLGTFSQLCAQVGGVALLVACCTVLPDFFTQNNKPLRQALLGTVFFCGLALMYMELLPLLGLCLLLYLGLSLYQGFRPQGKFWLMLGSALLLCLLLLNRYWINILVFINSQTLHAFVAQNSDLGALFPYFLIPSGLADLWNLQPLSYLPREPWLSATIALALLLTLFVVWQTLCSLKERFIPALMLGLMLLFCLLFFKNNSGFSLFKLAMYMQPFLFAVFCLGLYQRCPSMVLRVLVLCFLSCAGLSAQYYYLICSHGSLGRGFVELPQASELGLPQQLQLLSQDLAQKGDLSVIVDTPNIVSAKILSSYLQDHPSIFYSASFFTAHYSDGLVENHAAMHNLPLIETFYPKELAACKNLSTTLKGQFRQEQFKLLDPKAPGQALTFIKPLIKASGTAYLLASTSHREVFNRRSDLDKKALNFELKPLSAVSNHLIFISSNLGQHYYLGEREHIAVNGLNKDSYFIRDSGSWLGSYLLFQVLKPSTTVRVELSVTSSLNHDGSNLLPKALVVGQHRYTLPLMGRGSARVFSPAFSPQLVDGQPYLLLNLQENDLCFPSEKKGLMKLFGRNLNTDYHLKAVFARDLSLVSENDYQKLSPPTVLQNFPADLSNPNLEYSGIYEDGWISEDAFFRLRQKNAKEALVIKGELPSTKNKPHANELRLLVDGKIILRQALKEQHFVIEAATPKGTSIRKVELHFAKAQRLSKGDDRPVSAKITYLGFMPST